MENTNNQNNYIDANENINDTNVQATNNEIPKESKGGDSSRAGTALLILLILIPTTILNAVVWQANPTGIIGVVADVYKAAYQVAMGIFLIIGLNEAVNFISPKDGKLSESNILFFPLLILSLSAFIGYSINNFGITLFGHYDVSTWLIIDTILFLVVTSVSTVNFKDVMIAWFLTISLTLFLIAISWAIMHGGWQIVLLLIGIAAVSDTMSYYGGKKHGKRKAFPEVSPNKTIEGVITGFFSAIAFGWIFWLVFIRMFGDVTFLNTGANFSSWIMLLIILVGAGISTFGDLTYSKIKRSYDKKDFSNLLPGHGGIFDRLDSHIFVTVVSVILMTSFL